MLSLPNLDHLLIRVTGFRPLGDAQALKKADCLGGCLHASLAERLLEAQLKYHGLLILALATPSIARSEPLDLVCDLGFLGGSVGLSVDQDAGDIALVGPTGMVGTRIPYTQVTERLIFAFWLGRNSGSLITLSLDTLTGATALTQVGGQDGDRLAKNGTCSARN